MANYNVGLPKMSFSSAIPNNGPVGGGSGYANIVTSGDYTVSNEAQLASYMVGGGNPASSGEVVFVDSDIEITTTPSTNTPLYTIPTGVTLASDRGNGASNGAKISAPNLTAGAHIFTPQGTGCRVTGLILEGDDSEVNTAATRGVETPFYIEIDNCEMRYFGHDAVHCDAGCPSVHVHHNYIHNNDLSAGLQYGVNLADDDHSGIKLIEWNIFDAQRHAINASGEKGQSYIARYNLDLGNHTDHVFDCHGGDDRSDGTDIAGSIIEVYGNEFRTTAHEAFVLRGIPVVHFKAYNNKFAQTREFMTGGPSGAVSAIRQTNDIGGTVLINNNNYGNENAWR